VTQGSSLTYAYDDGLNRVSQTVGNTTTIYPNKFYSVTSSTNGANTYSTTTVYVWNGDTLVATIDQAFINGAATGTAATRYIHPDHLGSTNIVTDESGNIADDVEYYPYGEMRINQPTYPTNAQRQYIGQFKDGNSLSYLNARYLNSQQGQFLSEDPVFLGDPSQQVLTVPQSLNAYSYANDNPIVNSDPRGLWAISYSLASIGAEEGFGLFAGGTANVSLTFVSRKEGGIALTMSSGGAGGYLQNSASYPTSPSGQASFVLGAFGSAGCGIPNLCSGPLMQLSGSWSPTVSRLDDLNGPSDAINANLQPGSFTYQVDANGNATYGASVRGISKGASVSRYPVNTKVLLAVPTAGFVNAGNSAYRTAVNAGNNANQSFQSAVAQIQAKINYLKAAVAQLVASRTHN
jgi:RHS repeat-associated protein